MLRAAQARSTSGGSALNPSLQQRKNIEERVLTETLPKSVKSVKQCGCHMHVHLRLKVCELCVTA